MGKVTMAGTGGGADLDVITAAANDVLAGKVIVGPDGEPLTGTLALTGTAADSQVLSGKTYYNTDAKTKRTGTMLTMGGQTITPGAAQQTVSCAGKYMTGNIVVNGGQLLKTSDGTLTSSGSKLLFYRVDGTSAYFYYVDIPTGFTPVLVTVLTGDDSTTCGRDGSFNLSTMGSPYGGFFPKSLNANIIINNTKVRLPVASGGTQYWYKIAGY